MTGSRARGFILCLALVLGSAAPSQGFFGSADKNKITVLWVPDGSFAQWDQLDDILEHYKDLKFTMAVAPEDVPPDAAKRLAAWSAAGRLELALRLKGDPILPLIANHASAPRPQDTLDRLMLAREKYKELFGAPPIGFSAGGGAVNPSMFPAFGAAGLAWVGCGDYAGSSTTWAASGPTALVPFKAAQTFGRELSAADLSLPDYARPDAFVVDEADGLVPAGSWLRLLKTFSEKHPRPAWSTVEGAVRERQLQGSPAAASVRAWPTWAGGTALWNSHHAARDAWKLYGETALALSRYQNSGVADIKNLEDASAELYLAQSGLYYRHLSEPQSPEALAADRELRARLSAVYRKTKQTPPETLYVSLLNPIGVKGGGEEDDAEPGSTDVHFAQGEAWLAFENPPGSLGRAPEGAHPLADGTAAGQLWRIKSLRVEWDVSAFTFVYRMAKLDQSAAEPAELGPLLLDTYIDLNHRAGAGSVQLLPGRPGVVVARDAWEYALTVSGWGAYLYRSNPLGSALPAGKMAMTVDPAEGVIRVTLPSSFIKGNPLHWGFTVLAMQVDPATAVKPPPKPAVDPKRGAILGLLAPLERQTGLSSEGARPRLTAVRGRGDSL